MIGEIKKQTLTLMTAALAFVAALVWKDAMQAWLRPLYENSEGWIGITIAALVTTIVVIGITMLLTKWLGEDEKKKKK
ncbi:MAG: hypothetical protein KKG59_04065 [Nanoarchaeota archaeon]|nr:hypothetical protein [Nanoarchaeota archaeon]